MESFSIFLTNFIMQITFTATFDESKLNIISQMKGYNPTIVSTVTNEDGTTTTENVVNPVSAQEYISDIYLGMIKNDLIQTFVNKLRQDQFVDRQLEEKQIRDLVDAAISYTIL